MRDVFTRDTFDVRENVSGFSRLCDENRVRDNEQSPSGYAQHNRRVIYFAAGLLCCFSHYACRCSDVPCRTPSPAVSRSLRYSRIPLRAERFSRAIKRGRNAKTKNETRKHTRMRTRNAPPTKGRETTAIILYIYSYYTRRGRRSRYIKSGLIEPGF